MQQQQALTRYLRDPEHQSPPADMNEARVNVYRDLVFNNLSQLLSGTFKVLIRIIGAQRWSLLVRGFLRDYRAQTPKFAEIAEQFLGYLATQSPVVNEDEWPAFLLELAHYEWVEMVLQQSDALALPATDPALLLERPLQISALAWPLAYVWPVHQLDSNHQPVTPPAQPTLLLVWRTADWSVKFSELSPLAWRLVQRIDEFPSLDGRQHLRDLSVEAGVTPTAAFMDSGSGLLRQFHQDGVLGSVV